MVKDLSIIVVFALIALISFGPFKVGAQPLSSDTPTKTESVVASTTPPAIQTAETESTVQIDPSSYVAGEILVKYKENTLDLKNETDKAVAEQIVTNLDMTTSDTIASQNLSVVTVETGTSIESAIATLESNPNVEYAEPNFKRSVETVASTSIELTNMWALHNRGQSVNGITGTADADTDTLEAWDIATGTDVIVAVIDTGVDYTHPDLVTNMWDGTSCVDENGAALGGCLHGYDFEYDDKDPLATSTGNTESHGTHVAGIIAASNNDSGTVGIAYGAKIMALRFGLDTASEVRAIDFARRNGAKIINASYAGSDFSQAEYDAIQRFQEAGGIFVASAGNNSAELGGTTNIYPATYDLANIISVAATNQDDGLASFSNYGSTTVDLAAPGTNILSLIPGGLYGYKSGTSMSAPMVSGAVALLESAHPSIATSTVKSTLLSTGDALSVLNGITASGRRLNVNAALLSLVSTTTPDITPPVITLIGSNPFPLTVGDVFTDPGATVTDDTDATSTITGAGAVDTATAGTYTLTYSATDLAGNTATSTTRSVVVSARVIAVPVSSGGGGGGGGSSSSSSNAGSGSPVTVPQPVKVAPSVPRPLTAVASPKVLGAATYLFTQNLRLGSRGGDVSELQKLLTGLGFYKGPVSGYFGPLTQSAVKAFQQSKGLEAVGSVGPQTRALVNSTSSVQHSAPTQTVAQLQTQLQILIAQLAALKSH